MRDLENRKTYFEHAIIIIAQLDSATASNTYTYTIQIRCVIRDVIAANLLRGLRRRTIQYPRFALYGRSGVPI